MKEKDMEASGRRTISGNKYTALLLGLLRKTTKTPKLSQYGLSPG
jgi:hypothetical protein